MDAFFQRLVRIRSRLKAPSEVGAQRSQGLAVKAGESGKAYVQAVWGTREMERKRVLEKNTCGEGASDLPATGNQQATRRKWAAVGVGSLPFGESRIKWSSKYPERTVGISKCQPWGS